MADTSLLFNVLARDRASAVLDKVGNAAKAALAVGATAALAFGVASVKAYAESEASAAKLTDALARFPATADTNISRLSALNEELAKKTRFDDDATASGQAVLAQFGLTGKQLEQLTPLMQDFAAKTGQDLPTAAEQLGKAMLGQGKALKQVGIDFQDAGSVGANFDQVMSGLRSQVGGFATKEGKTAAGQAAILHNQFGELQEKAGKALMPALLKVADALGTVIGFVDRNSKTIVPLVAVVGTLAAVIYTIVTATKIYTAVQTALNIVMAMNPIGLVIIAIAALVAIIALIATKTTWFQDIWKAVWSFIVDYIQFFWGIYKTIGQGIWNVLQWIGDKAVSVKNWIVGKWNEMLDFFRSVPGLISSAFGNLTDVIVSPFRTAFNKIASLWNSTVGKLSFSVPDWVPGVGGKSFSMPKVPMLARGGTIAQAGMAIVGENGPERVFLGQGARVEPLSRGGGATTIVFTSDGTRTGDLITELIRTVVRQRGRGNVQVAFGR